MPRRELPSDRKCAGCGSEHGLQLFHAAPDDMPLVVMLALAHLDVLPCAYLCARCVARAELNAELHERRN